MTRAGRGVDVNTLLTLGLLAGGVYVVSKVLLPLLQGVRNVTDKATTAAASAYVNATTNPVQLAEGIQYQLPNGSRVAAKLTQSAGAGMFTYLGIRYRLTASLGGGVYSAVRA